MLSMRFGYSVAVLGLAAACSSAPDAESFPLETGGGAGAGHPLGDPNDGGGQAAPGGGGTAMAGGGGASVNGTAGTTASAPPAAAGRNGAGGAGSGGSSPAGKGGRNGSGGAGGSGGSGSAAGTGGSASGAGGTGSAPAGGSPSGGSSSSGGTSGAGAGGSGSGVSYSTSFAADESPLSEGGKWKHNNPFFTRVVSSGGNAYGTSPNPANAGKYEDSYAFLGGMGFPPNQYASAHIYKNGATGGYLEVELLLRWADTANSTRGYECYLHQGGEYVTVSRWNGGAMSAAASLDYFSILGGQSNVTAPRDGDLFEAQIVGNIITVKLAGATMFTLDVSKFDGNTFDSGDPGIGFDAGASGAETADSSYGFKDFSARGL